MSHPGDWKIFSRFFAAGPLVLFLLAALYGALDRNVSNDLWVSLTSGQYILAQGEVPAADPFSYTAAGQPWFNQNWLSHVIVYGVYDRLGPDGLIISTWLIIISIFLLVAIATYLRCGSWPAALLGTALLAMASHGYLTPRPGTIGYLCFAVLAVILAALAHTGGKQRLWPALLLFPLLLFWGNAHGSFILAYGLVGLFVVCSGWALYRSPTAALCTSGQLTAVIGASVAALVMTLLFGPYGIDNFTHPFMIAGSGIFRTVDEWLPPYVGTRLPPVLWFWLSLAAGIASLIIVGILRRVASADDNPSPQPEQHERPQTSLFDIPAALLGLAMALWARRFIPLLFILALPAVMTWLMKNVASLAQASQMRWRQWVTAGSWAGAAALAWFLTGMIAAEYIEAYKEHPQYGLFDRAIVYEEMPDMPLEFLKRNDLGVRLFAPWWVTGLVMWKAPAAKVFIDARAQQVYSEAHYIDYHRVLIPEPKYAPAALQILRQSGTDALLLQATPDMVPLMRELDRRLNWIPVFFWDHWVIYLRRHSDPLKRLMQLERAGSWWPEAGPQQAAVGNGHDPVVLARALYYYKMAIAKMPGLGLDRYMLMTRAWLALGQPHQAEEYLGVEERKLSRPVVGVDETLRGRLLQVLAASRRLLTP